MGKIVNPCVGTGERADVGPNGIGHQCPSCGMLTIPYKNGTVRLHSVLEDGPPQRPKAARLIIRTTAEELDWVKHAADLRGLSMAEYVTRAINVQLRREGGDAVLFRQSDDPPRGGLRGDPVGRIAPIDRTREKDSSSSSHTKGKD